MAICADRAVVGEGRAVVRDAAVVLHGGAIVEVGPAAGLEWAAIGQRYDFGNATVLPGLIDAHVHLSMSAGESVADHQQHDRDQLAERVDIVRAQLLRRGVTTVRDLGCRVDVMPALRQSGGGPETAVLTSGAPVTSPGGHFWPLGMQVRGVDQMRAAVVELHALGANVVKVMATGGAMTRGTFMGRAQFGVDELRTAVETAHERGLRVAAHAHGVEGIAVAVRAGVDTIEHCSWCDVEGEITQPVPALLDQMAANGQTVVSAGPLAADVLAWFETGYLADTHRVRRQLALWRNARVAADAGVTVALATDSVYGAVPGARDLEYRVRALSGLLDWPMLDLLQMITGNAATALGTADRGQLGPGAAADVAVFRGDLTRAPDGLDTPLAVWKDGAPVHLDRTKGPAL